MDSRPQRSETTQPSGKISRWLLSSIALNLALGVWLLLGHRRAPTAIEAPEVSTEAKEKVGSTSGHRSSGVQTVLGARGTPWSELETTNLTEFAANLRRVGCPDETICDLLRPAAARWFTSCIQAADSDQDFWAVGLERQKQHRSNIAIRSALRQEERQFLSAVTCRPDSEMYNRGNWMEAFLLEIGVGSMSLPQREDFWALMRQMEARTLYWRERTDGIFLPEEVDAIHQEHAEFIAKLGSLLSTNQQDEFLLRLLALFQWGNGLPPKFAHLHLNGPQLREFCRICAAQDSSTSAPWWGYLTLLDEVPPPAPWPQTVRDMTALLGVERSIEGFEIIDKDFDRSMDRVAQASNPTLAHQIIDRVIAWKSEVYEFRERWNTNPDGVESSLPVAAQEVRKQLTGLLANTAIPPNEQHALITDWIRETGGAAWWRRK
jgi:hypothetical protein